jgi:hypothetical protein
VQQSNNKILTAKRFLSVFGGKRWLFIILVWLVKVPPFIIFLGISCIITEEHR